MSDSLISTISNTLSASSGDPSVGIAVLRKALDAEATTASALLDALPPVQRSSSLPPNLGNHINTTA